MRTELDFHHFDDADFGPGRHDAVGLEPGLRERAPLPAVAGWIYYFQNCQNFFVGCGGGYCCRSCGLGFKSSNDFGIGRRPAATSPIRVAR
jgi:hypothetical protein